MGVEVEGYEYAVQGDGYCRRKVTGLKEPWETNLTGDDLSFEVRLEIELQARLREERRRAGPRGSRHIITRSDRNIAIAEELGFDGKEPDLLMNNRGGAGGPNAADTLAQRLTDRSNTGTGARVTETRFDAIAKDLGFTPAEIRARFAGEHVPDSDAPAPQL